MSVLHCILSIADANFYLTHTLSLRAQVVVLVLRMHVKALGGAVRTRHKIAVFALLYNGNFYARRSLLYNGEVLCQDRLAVTQGKRLF